VPELDRIARRVAGAFPARAQPLLLTFDRLVYWARPQILCALGTEEPAADTDAASALALAATLKSETVAAGLVPISSPSARMSPWRARLRMRQPRSLCNRCCGASTRSR